MKTFAFVLPCLMVNINVWKPIVMNSIPHIKSIDKTITMDIPRYIYGLVFIQIQICLDVPPIVYLYEFVLKHS